MKLNTIQDNVTVYIIIIAPFWMKYKTSLYWVSLWFDWRSAHIEHNLINNRKCEWGSYIPHCAWMIRRNELWNCIFYSLVHCHAGKNEPHSHNLSLFIFFSLLFDIEWKIKQSGCHEICIYRLINSNCTSSLILIHILAKPQVVCWVKLCENTSTNIKKLIP